LAFNSWREGREAVIQLSCEHESCHSAMRIVKSISIYLSRVRYM